MSQFALVLLVALAAPAGAKDCSEWLQSDGLGKLRPVPQEELVPGHIYARYNSDAGGMTWVTADDVRPLLAGSQAQGSELGFKGGGANISYTLGGDGEWRVQTTAGLDSRFERAGKGYREITRDKSIAPPDKSLPAVAWEGAPIGTAADLAGIYFKFEGPAGKKERLARGLPYLPRRIFVRYSARFAKWVYTMTDAQGFIADPPDALAKGSRVRGWSLGATNPYEFFVLASDGTWTATKEETGEEIPIHWTEHVTPRLSIPRYGTSTRDIASFTPKK